MSDFSILLDAPGEAAAKLQVAALGDYKDGRYGEFSITETEVASWQANLSKLPGGRALIDLDHRADRSPRNSEAAGWITGVEMADGVPMAQVEWTPVGQKAIEEKRYLFFSPTYGDYKDDKGNVHENTLVGGALTNKPFISSMPTLTLASEETLQAAVDAESSQRLLDALRGFGTKSADSQPAMDLTPTILKALGVEDEKAQTKILDQAKAEDFTEEKLLEALEAAKPEPTKPADEPKTLDVLLKEEGKVALDGPTLVQLQADATAGRDAQKKLHTAAFETAYSDAERQGKATPAQKERFQGFYALDAESTLTMLSEAPQVFNVKPLGGFVSADGDVTPEGVAPESHKLHTEILAEIDKDPKLGMGDYTKLLEQRMSRAMA